MDTPYNGLMSNYKKIFVYHMENRKLSKYVQKYNQSTTDTHRQLYGQKIKYYLMMGGELDEADLKQLQHLADLAGQIGLAREYEQNAQTRYANEKLKWESANTAYNNKKGEMGDVFKNAKTDPIDEADTGIVNLFEATGDIDMGELKRKIGQRLVSLQKKKDEIAARQRSAVIPVPATPIPEAGRKWRRVQGDAFDINRI
jgi:hypothetical protein